MFNLPLLAARVGSLALLLGLAGPATAIPPVAAPLLFPAVAAPRAHPYLLVTPERVRELKSRLQTDTLLQRTWHQLQARANEAIAQKSLSPNNLEDLVLAYQLTSEVRYAHQVRDVLLALCARPRWVGAEMLERTPPWQADLETARQCYNVALGFDGVYQALTADERRRIAEALVSKGVRPALNDWLFGDTRIHALNTMGHNWWSACVFMAGLGALAVRQEVPAAQGWAEQASAAASEWAAFQGDALTNKVATFDPAGGFYESVNYASFALSEYLLFRLAAVNAGLRVPELPLLEPAVDFFLHASYPTRRGPLLSVNFGDTGLDATGERPVKLLLALGYDRPKYAWLVAQARRSTFREGLPVSTPLGMLYQPPARVLAAAPAVPALPTSQLYPGMGWAMLRSSWAPDATLLAVKCGNTWNHAHADAGSFVLFHEGENLLIDSGTCGYARPEYTDYYCQSQAHNVVLFNGKAQDPAQLYEGTPNPGQVQHLLDGDDLKYVYADATGPTARYFARNFRHFLWVGDVLLVLDDLKAHEAGQFEWLLHTGAPARRQGQTLTVTKGTATVLVRPLFPAPFPAGGLPHDFPEQLRLTEKPGLEDHHPDTQVPYYAFSSAEPTQRTTFLTAITLVKEENKNHLPQVEPLTGPDMLGVRIRQHGQVTEVYFNKLADGRLMHRNANNTLGGYQTDAYLLAVTYPEGSATPTPATASRYFVADGSYLRQGGQTLLQCQSKVFLDARQGAAGRLDVQLQGQPVGTVALHLPQAPSALQLNHQPAPVTYRAADHLLLLPLAGQPAHEGKP